MDHDSTVENMKRSFSVADILIAGWSTESTVYMSEESNDCNAQWIFSIIFMENVVVYVKTQSVVITVSLEKESVHNT